MQSHPALRDGKLPLRTNRVNHRDTARLVAATKSCFQIPDSEIGFWLRPTGRAVPLCLCGFLLADSLLAHDPITTKLTWSREISRIIYNRCVGCHREGGSAPMPLVTYQQARPWAKGIKEQVLSRRMPPWGAVKGFGDFSNDRALSQEEMNLI